MSLFSQLHRTFLLYSQNRAVISLIFDRKAPEKLFSPKYRGNVLLGDVAEVAEEISWIAKRIKGRSSKQTLLEKAFTEKRFAVRDLFPRLKVWCPGQFYADLPKGNQILQSKIGQYWAPSCYHKTFQKSFIKNASQSVGHGWEVVEKYISGQRVTRRQTPYR